MVCLTSLKDVRKVDESCTSIRFLCLIFLVLCPIFVDKCRKITMYIVYHIQNGSVNIILYLPLNTEERSFMVRSGTRLVKS